MSSPRSDDLHFQVELPKPTIHHSSWSEDSLHPFDQLKTSSLTPNDLPNWNHLHHHHSPPLVTVSSPSPEEPTEADHGTLPQRYLVSQTDISSEAHFTHVSDSDADADDERPESPTNSLTDAFSENDSNDHQFVSGDCSTGFVGSQTTRLTEPDSVYAVSPSLTRPTRIRFRSRVRITSGLNRHRHCTNPSVAGAQSRESTVRLGSDGGGYFCFTPSSSISGSPSSSISAPLRSRTDDEADRPGWGPLGQRVSMFAKRNRMSKQVGSQLWGKRVRAEGLSTARGQMGTTETSPLLIPPSRLQAGRCVREHRRKRRCHCCDCGLSSQQTLSPEEVDETFGKWPSRILNYQWWWWHAEAVICCRCLDETDDEYH